MLKKMISLSGVCFYILFFCSCQKELILNKAEAESKSKLFSLLKIKDSDIGRSVDKAALSFDSYTEAYDYFSKLYKTKIIDSSLVNVIHIGKPKLGLSPSTNSLTRKVNDYGSEFVTYASTYIDHAVNINEQTTLLMTFNVGPLLNFAYEDQDYFPYTRTYSAYQVVDYRISDINFALSGIGSIVKSSENITTSGFTTYLTQSYTISIAGISIPTSQIIKAVGSVSTSVSVPTIYLPDPLSISYYVNAVFVGGQ